MKKTTLGKGLVWGSLSAPPAPAGPEEPGHQMVSNAFYTENTVLGKQSWKML